MIKIVKTFVACILLLLGGLWGIFYSSRREIPVGEFSLSDYKSEIVDFESDTILGKITNKNDVLENAESLWIELFGESVKKEKPYQLFYDKFEQMWLVQHCINIGDLNIRYLCQCGVVISRQCHRIAFFLRLALTQISNI